MKKADEARVMALTLEMYRTDPGIIASDVVQEAKTRFDITISRRDVHAVRKLLGISTYQLVEEQIREEAVKDYLSSEDKSFH